MKRVLITAGSVYGSLDDNKIVSNRARGLWATQFAGYLSAQRHEVTLLIPDTMPKDINLGAYHSGHDIRVIRHYGFESYQRECVSWAQDFDAAVMAAAVVNWIPANPIEGKMETKGYKPGDIINVPFILAPRVISEMRAKNPKLTLIGCKMLSGSLRDELIEAAYHVVLDAKCNVVVANDLRTGLRLKHLVYQDRTVVTHDDDFKGLYRDLLAVIMDEHYHTEQAGTEIQVPHFARTQFDQIVEANREGFIRRDASGECVFGSVAVAIPGIGWLVSPREKGTAFTSKDAVIVRAVSGQVMQVASPGKATLNAPLLIRAMLKYGASAVLHQHRMLDNCPTLDYSPPGTVRDNDRTLPDSPVFNILGHGFIKVGSVDSLLVP
jgi:hypothetical protein